MEPNQHAALLTTSAMSYVRLKGTVLSHDSTTGLSLFTVFKRKRGGRLILPRSPVYKANQANQLAIVYYVKINFMKCDFPSLARCVWISGYDFPISSWLMIHRRTVPLWYSLGDISQAHKVKQQSPFSIHILTYFQTLLHQSLKKKGLCSIGQ